jgi:hypothetical protein
MKSVTASIITIFYSCKGELILMTTNGGKNLPFGLLSTFIKEPIHGDTKEANTT